MTAPLCSTFLNATSAPDFPGDISAFFVDRPKEQLTDKAYRDNRQAPIRAVAATASVLHGTGASSAIGVVPKSLSHEEKSAQSSELRTKNSYFDKLEKMREVLRQNPRRKNHRGDKVGAASPDEVRGVGGPAKEDGGSASGSSPAELVNACDRLIRKTVLLDQRNSSLKRKALWNKEGVADALCPKKMEDDIRHLECVISRLQSLVQNESKMAVYLQKPPATCLRLDPRLHESASKVLGDRALKTVLEVVEAAEDVERFVESSNNHDAETSAMMKELSDHFDREKNHLAHLMTVVKKAVAIRHAPAGKYGR